MEYDLKRAINFAMLDIPESDYPTYQQEIDEMLKRIATLPNVEGEFALTDIDNAMPLREDVVKPSLKSSEALKNAPQVEAGCFVVPRFLD